MASRRRRTDPILLPERIVPQVGPICPFLSCIVVWTEFILFGKILILKATALFSNLSIGPQKSPDGTAALAAISALIFTNTAKDILPVFLIGVCTALHPFAERQNAARKCTSLLFFLTKFQLPSNLCPQLKRQKHL